MIKKLKYADRTTVILFVFVFLIFILFLNAYKIKQNIEHFSFQSTEITTLQLIDKEFYDFTFTINKLTSYDKVEKNEQIFRQTFQTLTNDLYKYNEDTAPLLKELAKSFQKKYEDLEYFKAQNSTLINSSHFLFDLHTTISDAPDISLQAKNITNELLFYLLRYASSDYIDKKIIGQRLDKLKIITDKNKNRYLSTFYVHTKIMLQTLESLKKVSKEIRINPLYQQLEALKLHITQDYKENLQQQTWLITLFFILTVLILFTLILSHLESNKTRQQLMQAATVFENTEEAIIITDAKSKIVSVNSAFTNIYGYKLNEIKGKDLSFLHSGVHDKNFYKDLWYQLINDGIWKGKFVNKTKAGENIPVWTTIKQIKNDNGDIVNYTAVQTDLREIETSRAQADYLAYHDALTGLSNRVNFEEYLKHALSISKRNKAMLAVLFIDLDRFKAINDTLGHDIGDEVLKIVAQRLKNTLRESDLISRWGGDEFVVIFENLDYTDDAGVAASKIIESLKRPLQVEQHSLITTASIGIALYPQNGEDSATLIKHADSAMYFAKESGKNNFRYYTNELSQNLQDRLNIDLSLRNALKNGEFFMVFQPQYKLSTKQIQAAEALIRWESPTLGRVAPDKFIPVAEENGVIIALGYFVFEESCKALKKMHKENVAIDYIAVNVSSLQFKESDLLQNFLNIVRKYGIKPSQIEIEITERFLMEHTVSNIDILHKFRDYGFKVSIDDFGTGYSSMSYLKQLPIDTVKIDKSFVDDIAQGSSDNVIIEAIIALSKTLGFNIVAEGIETREQETFLAEANCDLGQGYLFSRPVIVEDIIEKYS